MPAVRRAAVMTAPAVAFIALLAFATTKTGSPPQVGERAPDFTAPLLGSPGDVSLSDYQGRPVVLNFWASWCQPCKAEAPVLKQAHDAYGDEVAFLGIDVRDSVSDAVAFVRERGIDYPSVRDETRSIYRAYGLSGQPETFFIDAEGIVVEHVAGPILRARSLTTVLDVLTRRHADG